MNQYLRFFFVISVPLSVNLAILSPYAHGQDSGDQGTMVRGDRGEISVTVRDSSGTLIASPASVKLYRSGMPSDQSQTSHGRAFFIPRSFGDYTIMVDATGYKSVQKDVSVRVAGKFEVDIYLPRQLATNESTGAGRPILAPDAQKALTKGTQALREGNLDAAEKELAKAGKLAPTHPDVLYMQGMLYLRQSRWDKAESVLEKADQVEPSQPRVLSGLGMALCNQKKYEEAIPTLENAIRLDPAASWETDWALAKAYYFHEQYGQALEMAQQAHNASHGTSPQTELLLAQCFTAVGRYEDSAQTLRDFLKTSGKTAEAATAQHWLDNLAADGKIRR